ncbi:MAG TPA: nuclear transport factor 2 family protein [Miltoncostaeaceae bacterium]|nr:nuclear transport factor 2 family protein [Miltoncostaeaceae bacterium]
MGAPDLERIRAVYAALDAGDAGPLTDLMDPDIQWREPEGAPGVSGLFRGRAAVFTEVFARMPDVWQEFEVRPEEFIGDGDRVVVLGTLTVMALGLGGRAEVPFVHVWRMRGGRAVSWECHTDTHLLQVARHSR